MWEIILFRYIIYKRKDYATVISCTLHILKLEMKPYASE